MGLAKLQLTHNGVVLSATNMETGIMFLNALGLSLPSDLGKKNTKRKLDLMMTLRKGSKIPVRSPT